MPSKIRKRGKSSYELTVTAGYDAQGKQILHRKTVTCSEKEVERQYALFLADVQKGNITTQKKLTVKDFYSYWLEYYADKNLKPKTISSYDILFKRIELAIGHLYLDRVEPRHLHQFYKNLEEIGVRNDRKANQPLSSTMIQKHHKLLQTLYNKAVQWGFAPYNPCEKVEAPKAKGKQIAIYDEEQTAKLLDLLEVESLKYQAMILVLLTAGLRRGELFGLTWECIDFDKNTILVKQEILYLPQKGIFVSDLKTETSYRKVSIPDSVTNLLKKYKVEHNEKRLQLGDKWQGADVVSNDFVFCTWEGKPAHPDSLNNWLRKFTLKHNMPHISPRAFRHMNATYLIAGGVDVRTVSGKLGHSKPKYHERYLQPPCTSRRTTYRQRHGGVFAKVY